MSSGRFERDQAGDAEDDDARALGLDGGPEAARPRVGQAGDDVDGPAPAPRAWPAPAPSAPGNAGTSGPVGPGSSPATPSGHASVVSEAASNV